jgi:hypothetical protein
MSAEKSLKFQFVLDENSFNRVKRALDEMITKAQTLAKTLQGVGTGGGGFGGGGSVNGGLQPSPWLNSQMPKAQTQIGKVVLDNAAAFKNMANLGTASLKGMTDALKSATERQRDELGRLKASLEALGNAYDKLGGRGRNALAIQAKMVQVAGRITDGQDRLANIPAGQSWLPGISAPGAGGGTSPGMAAAGGAGGAPPMGWLSPMGNGPPNPMGMLQSFLGSTSPWAIAARMGMAVGTGAINVASQSQGWNNAMLDTKAARGQVMAPSLQRLMRSDISDLLKNRELATYSSDDRVEALRRSGSMEARYLQGLKEVAGSAKDLITGKAPTGLSDDNLDTETMKRVMETRDRIGETAEYYLGRGRAYGYTQETAGSRITGSRILGAGFYKDKRTGGMKDSYTGLAARLHEQGFSVEELAGATTQARNMGGRDFASKYAGTIMSANAAGYGQVGDVLAAAGRGAGNNKSAMGLLQGALGGGIDTAAGLQLGSSLFGFDPRGTVSGTGALKAIQQGFQFGAGGAQDLNAVARVQLGLQSADRLSGGFDGYGRGMNLVSAIGAMPGATTYAQDALAGRMSFKELAEIAGGGTSARASAYGISKGDAMSQIGGMTHGLFSRYVEQGGDDPVSRAMRAMKASGQSEQGFLAGLGESARKGDKGARSQLEALGVFASDLMGGDTEGGIGMIQALSGVKDLDKVSLKKGKVPGAGIDDETKARLSAEAENMRKSAEQLNVHFAEIVDAFGKIQDNFKAEASFGKLASSAEAATNRLYELAGVPQTDIEKGRGSSTRTATGTAASFWSKGASSNNTLSTQKNSEKPSVERNFAGPGK